MLLSSMSLQRTASNACLLQDLVAAAALLEKLRKEAEASRQLAEKAAAALTYGVDRRADRAHAADVVNRLTQLQNVRATCMPGMSLMLPMTHSVG